MIRGIAFGTALGLLGCTPSITRSNAQYVIEGEIDVRSVNGSYQRLGDSPGTIIVNSEGGNASAALALAFGVKRYGHEVVVDGLCMSSCAEFLITSAHSVSAVNLPIIGFHGSPGLDLSVAKKRFPDQDLSCIENLAEKTRRVAQPNVNLDGLWRQQEGILRPYNARLKTVSYKDWVCNEIEYDISVDFWIPKSEELLKLGIPIRGQLCSDVPGCLERRVPSLLGEGITYAT